MTEKIKWNNKTGKNPLKQTHLYENVVDLPLYNIRKMMLE